MFKIGSPLSEAYMGALIESPMQDRYLKFAGISEREGAEIIMRGKPLSFEEKGNFVTPTLAVFESITPDQVKKSVSLQTEILSPHVSLIQFKEYEELAEICAPLQHGLCASIWGENKERLQKIATHLPFGQIQFNQSLLEWNPSVSFQPKRKSGNHAYQGMKLWGQLTALKSIE